MLIAYDIENDRKRSRISKLLLESGLLRVQKSVFEGRISETQLRKLKTRLKKGLKGADSIRYYHLCESCRSRITAQGNALFPETGPQVIIE